MAVCRAVDDGGAVAFTAHVPTGTGRARGVELRAVWNWLAQQGCFGYGPEAAIEWRGLRVVHGQHLTSTEAREWWASWWGYARSVDAVALPEHLREQH